MVAGCLRHWIPNGKIIRIYYIYSPPNGIKKCNMLFHLLNTFTVALNANIPRYLYFTYPASAATFEIRSNAVPQANMGCDVTARGTVNHNYDSALYLYCRLQQYMRSRTKIKVTEMISIIFWIVYCNKNRNFSDVQVVHYMLCSYDIFPSR